MAEYMYSCRRCRSKDYNEHDLEVENHWGCRYFDDEGREHKTEHKWQKRKRPYVKPINSVFQIGDCSVETGAKERRCRGCQKTISNTEFHLRMYRIAQSPANMCEDCVEAILTAIRENNNA
jgi:hypothetical protein